MTSWQVSESGASIALDAQGRGAVTVTVTNPGPDQDRAVLSVTPLDGASREWFDVEEPQRVIAGGDSAVYVVQVQVPEGTPEGSYAFQAVAYSADRDPGESSTTGRRVVFDVTAPDRSSFPWWIVAVVVVLLLLIGAVVWWLSGGDPPSNVEAPTIDGTPTVLETLSASEGEWDGAEEFSYQWERCEPPEEELTDEAEAEQEADAGEQAGQEAQEGLGQATEFECGEIDVGTGADYQIGNDDIGSRLRVVVTASNDDGSATATSDQTGVVSPLPPAVDEVPGVVGLRRSEAVAILSENFQALQVAAAVEATVVCDPFVLSQAPSPGTMLELGETVAFTVPPVNPVACPQLRLPLLEREDFDSEDLDEFRRELDLDR